MRSDIVWYEIWYRVSTSVPCNSKRELQKTGSTIHTIKKNVELGMVFSLLCLIRAHAGGFNHTLQMGDACVSYIYLRVIHSLPMHLFKFVCRMTLLIDSLYPKIGGKHGVCVCVCVCECVSKNGREAHDLITLTKWVAQSAHTC
jgi:hypothetical protein